MGHNWGSDHDSGSTCAPGGQQGNFIMYDHATDGSKVCLNGARMLRPFPPSPCTDAPFRCPYPLPPNRLHHSPTTVGFLRAAAAK
jgi:hypothetical protein